jgi:hypothetical protein
MVLVLVTVAALGLAGCSKSESQSAKKDATDAQKASEKAAGDMANAFNKQKDAVVKKGQKDFDDLQKQIDDLNTKAKDSPEYKDAKDDLNRAKAEASSNLKALKNASKDGWDDAVKDYDAALAGLKKAYNDAAAKIKS